MLQQEKELVMLVMLLMILMLLLVYPDEDDEVLWWMVILQQEMHSFALLSSPPTPDAVEPWAVDWFNESGQNDCHKSDFMTGGDKIREKRRRRWRNDTTLLSDLMGKCKRRTAMTMRKGAEAERSSPVLISLSPSLFWSRPEREKSSKSWGSCCENQQRGCPKNFKLLVTVHNPPHLLLPDDHRHHDADTDCNARIALERSLFLKVYSFSSPHRHLSCLLLFWMFESSLLLDWNETEGPDTSTLQKLVNIRK